MRNNDYAVLLDEQYYHGDAARRANWQLSLATVDDIDCIGSGEDCVGWLDELESADHTLAHGIASYHYRIVRIVDADATYDDYLSLDVDWDGCPKNQSYEDDCAWAEQQAYDTNGIMPVAIEGAKSGLILVDLAVSIHAPA